MGVIVGYNKLEMIPKVLAAKNTKKLFLIIDKDIQDIYLGKILEQVANYEVKVYSLEAEEKNKSINTVLKIYNKLINHNFDKSGVILSVGGGVVGDIAGFVASTYMRGIDYIQIPTTLLAQVDSSIGGKVGVDYKGLKNIIGSFYFPIKTIIDVKFLESLDKKAIVSGLGEILKYGLIEDYDFFKYVNENLEGIFQKDIDILTYIVKKSVTIKENIVKLDKLDKGIRKKLNFGHTIGHSIEALYSFKRYSHGEAVILGMLYESYISREIGLIENNYFNSIYKTLTSLVEPISFKDNEIKRLLDTMSYDKKNINAKIGFILPTGVGKVDVFYDIKEENIKKALKGRWI